MKKLSALLLFFATLMISGCSMEPPDPVLDFTAQVTVNKLCFDDEFYIEARLISTKQGAVSLKITTPDELSPLCYKWSDKFEMSWNDLCCRTDVGYLPKTSFAQTLYRVLCDLSRNGVCTGFKDGTATFEGKCESGGYTVTANAKGYICNISVEEINLSADFSYE